MPKKRYAVRSTNSSNPDWWTLDEFTGSSRPAHEQRSLLVWVRCPLLAAVPLGSEPDHRRCAGHTWARKDAATGTWFPDRFESLG
jgi:hypothetical protein